MSEKQEKTLPSGRGVVTNILLLLILLVLCPILIPIGLGLLGLSIMWLVWLVKAMAPFLLAAAVIAALVKTGLMVAAWQRKRNRHALKIGDSEER